MNEQVIKAIKTVCGGLYHLMNCGENNELRGRDWDLLCSYLKISPDTIHWLNRIDNGFEVTTRIVKLKYIHDQFTLERRTIELRY